MRWSGLVAHKLSRPRANARSRGRSSSSISCLPIARIFPLQKRRRVRRAVPGASRRCHPRSAQLIWRRNFVPEYPRIAYRLLMSTRNAAIRASAKSSLACSAVTATSLTRARRSCFCSNGGRVAHALNPSTGLRQQPGAATTFVLPNSQPLRTASNPLVFVC